MNATLEQMVITVKQSKAAKMFSDNVTVYGSKLAALAALDCRDESEAISMLAKVQTVSIYKRNGKVVVE